ncbi:MAG TPA: prolyl aminopeptidase [Ktedonobacteraceae bacterium]|nr:prolyl aminopeptidase [Ktedonobacteraceae bacterium]
MTDLYPEIEPYERGFLKVDGGNLVYWEICGSPNGKPAVVVHGGPGSGCSSWHRRLFDPDVYRVVLFDQRNCGRSAPHASVPDTNLENNTTAHLVSDMEQLRQRLHITSWLVFGGSWGCTLALAYAEKYPERVTEMILFGITTGRRQEVDWLFRGGVAIFFPEQWEQLRTALPEAERSGDIVEAYYRRLNDSNPTVRSQAADAWCLWESATPEWPPSGRLARRFRDPAFALAFARIVTHYMYHNLWLEDGCLLRDSYILAAIPAILVNGRLDFQAPLANAWELHRLWQRSELIIVDNAGHAADNSGITQELIRATDRFSGVH